MESAYLNLQYKTVEGKCSFPLCNKESYGTYAQIPLCKEHLEMAEFIRWLHYELEGGEK